MTTPTKWFLIKAWITLIPLFWFIAFAFRFGLSRDDEMMAWLLVPLVCVMFCCIANIIEQEYRK